MVFGSGLNNKNRQMQRKQTNVLLLDVVASLLQMSFEAERTACFSGFQYFGTSNRSDGRRSNVWQKLMCNAMRCAVTINDD